MSKSILCPHCGWKVMTYDNKGTMPMKSRCKNCRLLVTYFPTENKTIVGRVPERENSGGKRFY